MEKKIKPSKIILDDLKRVLLHGGNTTQEAIVTALESKGHNVNQSKISRLLRKINAIKTKNDQGAMVYCLPHDAEAPPIQSSLAELVIDTVANETMIVIKTSPGAASLIARVIDQKKCQILGTIAGDDTIFVAPESIQSIEQSLLLIRRQLGCC
ncbi:MAG: ArgR family transcriptional regulator [Legionellaceae bacterium]|nr:ArgR family transcriptional regulator [Legionellaceae bacterium]